MFKRHEVINIIQEAIEDYYNGEVVSDKPNEDGTYDIFNATVQKVNEKSIEITFEAVNRDTRNITEDSYIISVNTPEELKSMEKDELDEFVESGSKDKITFIDRLKYLFKKYNK